MKRTQTEQCVLIFEAGDALPIRLYPSPNLVQAAVALAPYLFPRCRVEVAPAETEIAPAVTDAISAV